MELSKLQHQAIITLLTLVADKNDNGYYQSNYPELPNHEETKQERKERTEYMYEKLSHALYMLTKGMEISIEYDIEEQMIKEAIKKYYNSL